MLSTLINTTETVMVPLKAIINEGGTQMRAGLDQETVKEYADALTNGAQFPPIILFHDGESYWLGDGFHRFAAWKRAFGMPGAPSEYLRPEIPAEVRTGDRRDAILFAAGANASHGLRRTNADKRRAVDVLLRDPEWVQWSNREIARRCAVDESTVRDLRNALTAGIPQSTARKGADGRTIDTTNIGAKRQYVPEDDGWILDSNGGYQYRHPATERATTRFNTKREAVAAVERSEFSRAYYRASQGAPQPITRPEPPPQPIPDGAIHEGAGRTPPPALTLDELVEDLGGYLAKESAADIQAAANGARNKVLETCLFVLQDMTYRHADMYRALGKIALKRGAPAPVPAPSPDMATVADIERHVSALQCTVGCLRDACENQRGQYYLYVVGALRRDGKRWDPSDWKTAFENVIARRELAANILQAPVPALVVNGDRPLPEWAQPEAPASPDNNALPAQPAEDVVTLDELPVVASVGPVVVPGPQHHAPQAAPEPAPAEPYRHPRYDDLFELREIFRLTIKSLREWATITGQHTDTLEAERGLQHLVEATNKLLEE